MHRFSAQISATIGCISLLLVLPGCDRTVVIKTGERFVSKFSKADHSVLKNHQFSLSKLIDSLKLDPSNFSLDVDKSDYLLSVYSYTFLVKQYAIVLGKNPVDDKLKEGDCCTPEGTFHIKAKYVHSKWNKFIWLDYPNSESLLKFEAAKKAGLVSAESSPGGSIGIHGVEPGFDYAIDYRMNWTAGCISLKNKDVDEIYNKITTSTRIIIHK